MMKRNAFAILCRGLLLLVLASSAGAAERPNVVWILSEDNSIHFQRHFFKGGAESPAIERMAENGLTFRHAFSNAPVCSVARSTLITGCYAPRIFTQFHRRYQLAPMPGKLRMFPAYLRDAGYYATNNSKKDYNAIEGTGVWDESSRKATWRNRPRSEQPFFHMESHGESHEGRLHFGKRSMDTVKTTDDPSQITLADYHPDTATFRYTHARYLDQMRVIDRKVAATLKKLEDDGLLEDTFVFYFGDHGGVLPRSKGYVYESGLHVPLVVRVPENFAHLVDFGRGESVDGFVSFIDFAPTVLRLAGVSIPDEIDGKPFLGEGIKAEVVNERQSTYGYADRFDEKYDLLRTVRVGRWQYIRSFQPYLPDGLNNNYRYKCLAFAEWRELYDAGKLTGPAADMFESKPVEMLFDCEADPHQVHNLANAPAHRDTLIRLRKRLRTQMQSLPDLSIYPESYLLQEAISNPVEYGQSHQGEIAELLDVADLALLSFEEAKPKIAVALASQNWLVRYWAAMVCTSFGESARPLLEQVKPLAHDESTLVRLRALEYLGSVGGEDPMPQLVSLVNSTEDGVFATEVLNSIVWFRDSFDGKFEVRREQFKTMCTGGDVDDRLNYINGEPYPK